MKAIIINEIGQKENALISTAIDDYSLRNLKEDTMVLHLFQHSGINMGIDDLKHENFHTGIQYYKEHNQNITLRQSGGRSIVADKGVLNMSLCFYSKGSVQENYDYYADFIKTAFEPLSTKIKVKEIEGAYCPGSSDMSIDNKKFCGTAQKKLGNKIEMDCYISINGNQKERSMLVKGFYEAMNSSQITIDVNSMESLNVLCNKDISINEAAELLIKEVKKRTSNIIYLEKEDFNQEKFAFSLEHTKRKNKQIKGA